MNAPPPPPPPDPQYQTYSNATMRPRFPPATLDELRAAAAGKKAAFQIAIVYLGIPFVLLMLGIVFGYQSKGPEPIYPAVFGLVVGHFWSAFLVRDALIKLDPLWKTSAKWATTGLVLGLLLPIVSLWFSIIVDLLSGLYFRDRKLKARFTGPKDAELVAWAEANPVPVAAPPFMP